jgi:hypothetical protein
MTGPRLKSGDIRSVGFCGQPLVKANILMWQSCPDSWRIRMKGMDRWRERKKDEGEVAMSGLFARQARVHYEY